MNLRELPDLSDAYKLVQLLDEKKKPKPKLWQDDYGDGKCYEKSDVDGKLSKREKEKIKTEGNQRNPEGSIKDRFKSKQTDPSKDNFTGIGDSIADIMKQNAAMKKAAAKKTKNESVGSAVDKTLSATADVAKVAGKVATGGVKVASKVAKGAAKTAATVLGTPIGVAKSLKKGFQSGTASESLNSTQLKDISEILSQIASKKLGLPEHHQVDENGKVIEHEDTVDEGIIGKAIQGVGKVVGGAENVATGAVKKTAGAAKKVVKTVGSAVSGVTRKEELELTGKFNAEEIDSILEAERDLGDRLHRKRKLYDKTTKKAMDYARNEGEAAGHARYRMSSISREMDGIKAKMKEKEK